MRPIGSGQEFGNEFAVLGSGGEYFLNVPELEFGLSAKPSHWLRNSKLIDASNGDVNGIDFNFVNGDAFADNIVDLHDLSEIFLEFGNDDPMVDLDGDREVDVADMTIVFLNFGQRGDP
jgi:hypothetical protein